MSAKRILLVEDDLTIRQLLSVILQNENYVTVKAANGREALRALEANKNHIDLILSDIMMPDMDGFEFIKEVKNDPDYKTIPFIFLSGKTDSQSRVMGLRLGADDYIPKPFNRDEVSLKIKLLLEKSTSLKKSTITGLSGNLKNMSIRELLQVINITRRTGTLVIITKDFSGALYFREGLLINAAIEDKWGEGSAIKLLSLKEGDFRFEPNPLNNIPAQVTHTSEELLKYCDYNHGISEELAKNHGLIVIKNSGNNDLNNEEKSVLQLISLNPDITIEEIEKLLGEHAEGTIAVLLSKGFVAESGSSKTEVNIPTPDIISVDTILNKLKQYENEHDLYATHIGLIGLKEDVEAFTITLVKETSAVIEKIKFDDKSTLSNIPNFALLKLSIGGQVIYLHILARSGQEQQFLWDAVFSPTVGTIVLRNNEANNDMKAFISFADQRNYKYALHDITTQSGKPNIRTILTLIDKVL